MPYAANLSEFVHRVCALEEAWLLRSSMHTSYTVRRVRVQSVAVCSVQATPHTPPWKPFQFQAPLPLGRTVWFLDDAGEEAALAH
jgi:hypothetical protein